MERKPVFTLSEIAGWAENREVSLPTVQRGFVWKPSQIEYLWDSLLRGFPVGEFVLSPKEGSETYEVLDGQQRATAICLGFGKETFRDSHEKIKVFIDLAKPDGDDNRKYIFRVISKSHPWGYQRNDNTKTLSAENIRNAMDLYNIDDHLEAGLHQFFPYDAQLPIPFNLFIDAATNDSTLSELISEIKSLPYWSQNANDNLSDDLTQIDGDIQQILSAVKKMLHPESGQKIPALYLDFEHFKEVVDLKPGVVTEGQEVKDRLNVEEENLNASDEIENLFIRLNSGGTPIRGEELNYSILKAKISRELQSSIEQCCDGFMQPARFITIAFRLYEQKIKKDKKQKSALTIKIAPKQFQKSINDSKSSFESFLVAILSERSYSGKTLLQYAQDLLVYDENNNKYGLPYLIVYKIADEAPEVMLVYLYRIMIWQDKFAFGAVLHKQMIGMITLFMWLGKGENQRDHSKLLSNIWPCASTLEREKFWSPATVQRAQLNEVLTPFPTFNAGDKSLSQLKNYSVRINTDVVDKFDKATTFGLFLYKIFYNRDLILYAQRDFLSKVFKSKQYHLDDTNMPFDWDHIAPYKFVHNKKGLPYIIKEWYNSNGNYRAWPYSLNRMDQDSVPAIKLNPLDNVGRDPNGFKVIYKKWSEYITRNPHLIDTHKELSGKLLAWSFCSNNWVNCREIELKKSWRKVYDLIIERNLSITKEWYKQLEIESLIPSKKYLSFPTLFNKGYWSLNPKTRALKSNFSLEAEGVNSLVSEKYSFSDGSNIYLYINFNSVENLLNENGIVFGIFEEKGGGFVDKITISKKKQLQYEIGSYEGNFIQGYFTLISYDEDSYVELMKEFSYWLKNFPNKEVRGLVTPFLESFKDKFLTAIDV